MTYVVLLNLQIVLFCLCPIIKGFEMIFIYHLAIGYIVVYYTTIILHTVDKMAHSMKF